MICELREKHSLDLLLQISGVSRSTYYYWIMHFNDRAKKDHEILALIIEIFQKNHQKYGYPRITQELKNRGYTVNKKRVARLMKENGLSACQRKRKYHSYKGLVGKAAPNLLQQDFQTDAPYKKLGTDVTQFITPYGKLYLSPVIDFHTREVLSYDISENADYAQIRRMLQSLVANHGSHLRGAILHSDQGWQYQMPRYQAFLKENGIHQSMSRKGNCLDNAPTENFFGRLKTEVFYSKEFSFHSLQQLKLAISEYIEYYNNERIVSKLKCSPVQYKNQLSTVSANK